jgi:SAM-dependent methyltransferase
MNELTILNLGCGTKTSQGCINIDWSPHLRIVRNPILYWFAKRILSEERLRHLEQLKGSIRIHDLRNGIPFPDNTVDAVYHSHLLEHIDRHISRDSQDLKNDPAIEFVKECRRVLRPGGILRVVVPNFEELCRKYLAHLTRCEVEMPEQGEHDQAIFDLIGQEVMKEAAGSSRQSPLLRRLENLFLGDARQRGQTHQWEYDRINIAELLRHAGFELIYFLDYETSRIPDWNKLELDTTDGGVEHRSGSLYVEAVK